MAISAKRLMIAALLLASGGPVFAQGSPSACAALPESGPVAQRGADIVTPATATADRSWRCDPDSRRDLGARVPRCITRGIKVVDGSPRNACYAAMPFGPVSPIADRLRPTATCAQTRQTTVVALRGANVGWSDVAIVVAPDRGVTMSLLTDAGAKVVPAENPVLQGCFAFDCRLVKLDITSRAAAVVEVQLSLPGREPLVQAIKLAALCPH